MVIVVPISNYICFVIKQLIKKTLDVLHIDLTKNRQYDRLTRTIMHKLIGANSNCIDVGCHKGEMLDIILRLAPGGKHFAFEPIPALYEQLRKKYHPRCAVYPVALSELSGETTFHVVTNAPAYSGIRKRSYAIRNPVIEEITVKTDRLDTIIPADTKIDFIKIDVEGAELGVLRGAEQIIRRDKPAIIFECGLGASDHYGTKPEVLFDYMAGCGMKINTLSQWLNKDAPLTREGFSAAFHSNSDYYFIAGKA